MPTGALMSTTASQQGETIPGVCHAIVIESDVEENKKIDRNKKRRVTTTRKVSYGTKKEV